MNHLELLKCAEIEIRIKFPGDHDPIRKILIINDRMLCDGLSRKGRDHDLPAWWPRPYSEFERENEHAANRREAIGLLKTLLSEMIAILTRKLLSRGTSESAKFINGYIQKFPTRYD